MGLITGLVTLPLAPVRGVVWIAEQVQKQAEQQHTGREAIYRRLAEIEASREAGELSAEESAELEERAFDDLRRIDGEVY